MSKIPDLTLDLELDSLLFFFESVIPDVPAATRERMARVICDSVVAQERLAVDEELDRLNGFLGLAQLCEDDLNRMLIWVKNSKWALIAPKGEDIAPPARPEGSDE